MVSAVGAQRLSASEMTARTRAKLPPGDRPCAQRLSASEMTAQQIHPILSRYRWLSAQRLSASEMTAPSSIEEINARSISAQRLSASEMTAPRKNTYCLLTCQSAQRLSASEMTALPSRKKKNYSIQRCSTPFGIGDDCTRRYLETRRRGARVLNAFRHRR